jgi:RNA polymerase sigma-70 factor, ECF subfamily
MDEEFEQHRRYLFGIAYRMLSSVSDAEDIVQDTYLRYAATPRESIRALRPFLTTILTRLCLNQLQSARVRRETYVGPWLPEPLRTDASVSPGASNHVADEGWDEDSISMAFLVLLERLTPLARAVFLLREVFDYEYAEIAHIVERDEAACRQIFSRARKELARDQRRFKPSPETHERILRSFVHAVTDGDMQGLMDVLTDDVVVWADGGGRIRGAATRPLRGREAASTFLISSRRFAPEGAFTFELVTINAQPGVIMRVAGRPFLVINADIADDRISTVRLIATPDKLSGVDR